MALIDSTVLADAIRQLQEGLAEAEQQPESELLRDGVIQRFEYSHELAWKLMRRTLEVVFGDSVDEMPFNNVLRTAFERKLITAVEPWFEYRKARNKTSHTYDAKVAAEVYASVKPFLHDGQYLLQRLHELSDRRAA